MRPDIGASFRVLRSRSLRGVFCLGLLLNLGVPGTNAQQSFLSRPGAATGPQPESGELVIEAFISNKVFKFAGGELSSMAHYAGIEYDQHSSGVYRTRFSRYFFDDPAKFAHARPAYVAEVIPVFLLRQPAYTDIWGDSIGSARKSVMGIAVLPLGFRWIWRYGDAFRPVWTVKLGEALFSQKALGTNASYENFDIHSDGGFEFRFIGSTDLRLAYGYQHISNGYLHKSNPGLDTLGPSFGIVYHFASGSRW